MRDGDVDIWIYRGLVCDLFLLNSLNQHKKLLRSQDIFENLKETKKWWDVKNYWFRAYEIDMLDKMNFGCLSLKIRKSYYKKNFS